MINWKIAHRVDLGNPREEPVRLPALMVPGDNSAHTWSIAVRSGKQDADLTGYKAMAYFVRADDQTVVIQGAVSGSVVSVTLAPQCYAVLGRLLCIMRISSATEAVTVGYMFTHVVQGPTDMIVDPEHRIPSLEELLAQIAAMEAATAQGLAAANSANTAAQNADAQAQAANEAAQNANAATQAAGDATQEALKVAARWENVDVGIEMLSPDGQASADITQTDDTTAIHLAIPQGRVTNATLYMDDAEMAVRMRMPVVPEIGIDYALDDGATELYRRVHGY